MKGWKRISERWSLMCRETSPRGDRLIKLNTNENPYPPAPGVEKALREMDPDRFRKYPDPASAELVEALADYYGVGADQVFVGVGSDDVIAMAFLTFFNSEKPVLFPDITYSFYKVWAELFQDALRDAGAGRGVWDLPGGLSEGKRGDHFPQSQCALRASPAP